VAELHPQLRQLADVPALSPVEDPAELAAIRADYVAAAERLGGPVEGVARTADVDIPRPDGSALGARAYWPARAGAPVGALVWLHGGGWYVGDIESFDRVTRQLANASGAVCLSVDYRLAPEHPYPAAVHDARAAVAWAAGDGAAQLGTDPARVLVGGDSAGGNLATVAARHERDAVRAQLLVYPALDAALTGASHREFADGPLLGTADMERCWDLYLGDADRSDPDASPLNADDLAGVAPAYIAVAGHDLLRDDGLRYAEALRAAGVDVTLERYDDMVHSFLRWGGVVDRARELIEALGDYARASLR
jgi:acetyl esterase